MVVIFIVVVVVVVVTKDYATTAADDGNDANADADAVFLIEIKIDQGVIEVGSSSSSRSSIHYCC